MKPLPRLFRQIQREDGSALVELALVIPIVTAMLVGVVNFGLILQQNIAVADSARAGAEFALLPGQQTNTSVMTSVATSVAGNIPHYSATAVNVCTCAPGSAAVACSSSCPSYGQPAMYAQVTATATLPLLFGTSPALPVSTIARVRVSCPSC